MMQKEQSLGKRIAESRKSLGMTQLELAERLGVTDKAVSKWERDLSCPDISLLPEIAKIFNVSLDTLMDTPANTQDVSPTESIDESSYTAPPLTIRILYSLSVAMGIAVTVLSIIKEIDLYSGFTLLGIGLSALSIAGVAERSGIKGQQHNSRDNQ